MGSEAWIHALSVRGRLRIMLWPDLNFASYCVSSGWSAQGQQRRVHSSLEALTEYLSRMRALCVARSVSLSSIRLSSAVRAVRASDSVSRVERAAPKRMAWSRLGPVNLFIRVLSRVVWG